MDVWVGHAGLKQWRIQNLEDPPQPPELWQEVMIHFYIDHKEKPIPGYVSRIIDQEWFVVRAGKRQKPTL